MNDSKLSKGNELKNEIQKLSKYLEFFSMTENDYTREYTSEEIKRGKVAIPKLIERERVGVYISAERFRGSISSTDALPYRTGSRGYDHNRFVFDLFKHISDEQFDLIINMVKSTVEDKLRTVKIQYEAL